MDRNAPRRLRHALTACVTHTKLDKVANCWRALVNARAVWCGRVAVSHSSRAPGSPHGHARFLDLHDKAGKCDSSFVSVMPPMRGRMRRRMRRLYLETRHCDALSRCPRMDLTLASQFFTDSWRDGELQARYIFRDAKRHPRNFVVAVTTVVVVVAFLSCVSSKITIRAHCCCSLLLSAIQQSAIVFVKLSENQVGEYDLVRTEMP